MSAFLNLLYQEFIEQIKQIVHFLSRPGTHRIALTDEPRDVARPGSQGAYFRGRSRKKTYGQMPFVLFGSDWTHAESLAAPTSFVRDLKACDPGEQKRVTRENAVGLLAPAQ